MTVFTAAQALERSGLSYAQLDRLAAAGILTPSVAAAQGKGSRRLYSRQDVAAAVVAAQLRNLGLAFDHIAKVTRRLQRMKMQSEAELEQMLLVVCGHRARLVRAEELGRIITDASGPVVVCPLKEAVGATSTT